MKAFSSYPKSSYEGRRGGGRVKKEDHSEEEEEDGGDEEEEEFAKIGSDLLCFLSQEGVLSTDERHRSMRQELSSSSKGRGRFRYSKQRKRERKRYEEEKKTSLSDALPFLRKIADFLDPSYYPSATWKRVKKRRRRRKERASEEEETQKKELKRGGGKRHRSIRREGSPFSSGREEIEKNERIECGREGTKRRKREGRTGKRIDGRINRQEEAGGIERKEEEEEERERRRGQKEGDESFARRRGDDCVEEEREEEEREREEEEEVGVVCSRSKAIECMHDLFPPYVASEYFFACRSFSCSFPAKKLEEDEQISRKRRKFSFFYEGRESDEDDDGDGRRGFLRVEEEQEKVGERGGSDRREGGAIQEENERREDERVRRDEERERRMKEELYRRRRRGRRRILELSSLQENEEYRRAKLEAILRHIHIPVLLRHSRDYHEHQHRPSSSSSLCSPSSRAPLFKPSRLISSSSSSSRLQTSAPRSPSPLSKSLRATVARDLKDCQSCDPSSSLSLSSSSSPCFSSQPPPCLPLSSSPSSSKHRTPPLSLPSSSPDICSSSLLLLPASPSSSARSSSSPSSDSKCLLSSPLSSSPPSLGCSPHTQVASPSSLSFSSSSAFSPTVCLNSFPFISSAPTPSSTTTASPPSTSRPLSKALYKSSFSGASSNTGVESLSPDHSSLPNTSLHFTPSEISSENDRAGAPLLFSQGDSPHVGYTNGIDDRGLQNRDEEEEEEKKKTSETSHISSSTPILPSLNSRGHKTLDMNPMKKSLYRISTWVAKEEREENVVVKKDMRCENAASLATSSLTVREETPSDLPRGDAYEKGSRNLGVIFKAFRSRLSALKEHRREKGGGKIQRRRGGGSFGGRGKRASRGKERNKRESLVFFYEKHILSLLSYDEDLEFSEEDEKDEGFLSSSEEKRSSSSSRGGRGGEELRDWMSFEDVSSSCMSEKNTVDQQSSDVPGRIGDMNGREEDEEKRDYQQREGGEEEPTDKGRREEEEEGKEGKREDGRGEQGEDEVEEGKEREEEAGRKEANGDVGAKRSKRERGRKKAGKEEEIVPHIETPEEERERENISGIKAEEEEEEEEEEQEEEPRREGGEEEEERTQGKEEEEENKEVERTEEKEFEYKNSTSEEKKNLQEWQHRETPTRTIEESQRFSCRRRRLVKQEEEEVEENQRGGGGGEEEQGYDGAAEKASNTTNSSSNRKRSSKSYDKGHAVKHEDLGEEGEAEETSYSFCVVKPLQSCVPLPFSSLRQVPDVSEETDTNKEEDTEEESKKKETFGVSNSSTSLRSPYPWKDCFLNAGSSVWTLAVSEEVPLPICGWEWDVQEGRERKREGKHSTDQRPDGNEGVEGGEQEKDREEKEEGLLVLAVGVHGRSALLTALTGDITEEKTSGNCHTTGLIQLWGIYSHPQKLPRFGLGLLHTGGSCRSLHWISCSSSLVYESESDPKAFLSTHRETREKQNKKKKEEQARRPCPWASRVGLLVGAFADDSLRIWSIPLDPFLDEKPCEEEEEEEEMKGLMPVDGRGNASDLNGRSVHYEVAAVACSAEETTRRKRRRDASVGNFGSKGGQKAFASEAKRCFFLPPVWVFRYASFPGGESLSSPFLCVASSPPPLPSSTFQQASHQEHLSSVKSLSSQGSRTSYENTSTLLLASGSTQGRLFLFSFLPPSSPLRSGESSSSFYQTHRTRDQTFLSASHSYSPSSIPYHYVWSDHRSTSSPSSYPPCRLSSSSSPSSSSATPHLLVPSLSSSSSSPPSLPCRSQALSSSRPRVFWSSTAAASVLAHLRCCAFMPGGNSSLLAVSAAVTGDDSSSGNSLLFSDLRYVCGAVGGGGLGSVGGACNAADIGGRRGSPLSQSIEAQSGCISSREIFDVSWAPIGRYLTVAATNAVVVNLQTHQVTQLPLRQLLTAMGLLSPSISSSSSSSTSRRSLKKSDPSSCRSGKKRSTLSMCGATEGTACDLQEGGGPGDQEQGEPKRVAKTPPMVSDRCCWSTSICGFLGLFAFDDGCFIMGALNLLEQRNIQNIDLIRWSLPTTTRQRSLISRGSSSCRSGRCRPTSGLYSGTSREASVVDKLQSGVKKVTLERFPVVEDHDDERLFFASLQRRLSLQFAAQQNRQAKLLQRRGILVDLLAKCPEKEPRAKHVTQGQKRLKERDEGGDGKMVVSEVSDGIRGSGEKFTDGDACSLKEGQDAQLPLHPKKGNEAEDTCRTNECDEEDEGKGEKDNKSSGDKGCPAMSIQISQQEEEQEEEEEEDDFYDVDVNPRILSLQRVVSVCPYRNWRFFGRRPLAIYGGAAGLIHIKVLQ